jgi:phosphoribosyl-dephospho-CoA transferase
MISLRRSRNDSSEDDDMISLRRRGRRTQRCCLLLEYLIQSCARGGRRIVEDMCYEIRRAEACVD